jgi:hypothetical protein
VTHKILFPLDNGLHWCAIPAKFFFSLQIKGSKGFLGKNDQKIFVPNTPTFQKRFVCGEVTISFGMRLEQKKRTEVS